MYHPFGQLVIKLGPSSPALRLLATGAMAGEWVFKAALHLVSPSVGIVTSV
jgi:hypothetical protein